MLSSCKIVKVAGRRWSGLVVSRTFSTTDYSPTSTEVSGRLLDMYKPKRGIPEPSKFLNQKLQRPEADTDVFNFGDKALPQMEEAELGTQMIARIKVLGSLYLSYIVSHHIVTQRGYISYSENKAQRAKFVKEFERRFSKTDLMLLAGQLVLKDREEANVFFNLFFKVPPETWTASQYLNFLAPYEDVVDYEAVWSDKFAEGLIPKYPKDIPFHILTLGGSENVSKLKPLFYSTSLNTNEFEKIVKGIERHGKMALELDLHIESLRQNKDINLSKKSLSTVIPYLYQATLLKHVPKNIEWRACMDENPWATVCTYFGLLDIHGIDLKKVSLKILQVLESKKQPGIQSFIEELPNNVPEALVASFVTLESINGFKGLLAGCSDEMFRSDLSQIGSSLIAIAPVYYSLQSDSFGNPDEEQGLSAVIKSSLEQDESIRRITEQYNVSEDIVVAVQFILDPILCLNKLVAYLGGNPDKTTNFHTTIRDYLIKENVPIIAVNSSSLEHQHLELGLPAVLDKSVVSRVLMINLSLADARSAPSYLQRKPLNNCLKRALQFGEIMYKLLLRRNLLSVQDTELRKSIYRLLTSDPYYRFMLENVEFFGSFIKDKTILEALFAKRSSRDMFAKQIGQYFTVLYVSNPSVGEQWVDKVATVYKEVFQNLTTTELNETLNVLSKKFNSQETYFDTLSNTNVNKNFNSAVKNLLKDFKPTKPIEGYDDDLMINQAVNLISYYVYSYLFSHELLTFTARHDGCLNEISNTESGKETLKQIGVYTSEANIDGLEKSIKKFVEELLGNKYRPFDPQHLPDLPRRLYLSRGKPSDLILESGQSPAESFWMLAQMPILDKNDVPLNVLLAVNSTVSISYFRLLKLSYTNATRLSESIKKLSMMGQSYYKFLLRYYVNRNELLSSEEKVEAVRILSRKAFKTRVVEESGIISKPINDSQYWGLVLKRMNNMFNKLKVGATAFDQNIMRILQMEPRNLHKWVSGMVNAIHLSSSKPTNGATLNSLITSDQIEASLEEFVSKKGSDSKCGK